VYRVIVEYYDSNTASGKLDLYMALGAGTLSNVFTTTMKPGYGLATSTKAYDATLGNSTSTTNFGAMPELGMAQSSSLDPTGLNLTTSSTYETPGATGSFIRQTAKYLPGANTAVVSTATQYAHYAATDTKDNPCTTGTTEAFKQGGFMKLKTEPDPDGTGSKTPRTTETIYDDAGRVVATRYNTDSWTCTAYDTRGRVTTTTIPAYNGNPARTVTNNYAVSGNPLQTSSTDVLGTIVTTVNLLGQTVDYADVYGNWTGYEYNALGQNTRKYGDMGEEIFTYDTLNRLSQHIFDEVTYATVVYDAYSRIDYIDYNNAGSMRLTYAYDTLGRESSSTYRLGNGTTTVAESVTRTQSNQITGTSVVSGASTLNTTYTYDAADRLTGAAIGANTYSYGFGTQNSTLCGSGTGTNANSGKNSNRTTQTINGVTTNFCYDYADRLTTSSNTLYNTPVYDTHGNMTKIGTNTTPLELSYDSSDRSSGYEQINASNGNGVGVYYDRDVQGRIIGRYKSTITGWNYTSSGDWFYNFTGTGDAPDFVRNAAWDVIEQNLTLPGGVLLTLKPQESIANNKKQYSLPNTHGDTLLMTNAAGTNTSNGNGPASSFAYDPFGQAITGSVLPANTNGASYGWVGQHQKFTETALALAPIPMGARVYLPGIGRFTQVDSVEGGTENSFVYPADPISKFDLTGNYFETIYDIGSLIYDINELRKSKSWSNAGWVAWDVAAIALPVVPGAGGARAAAKAGKKAKAITDAKQIADQAKKLGYATRKNAKQLDNVTNGQPGFINGRKMISRDVDNHNCTNCWKVFIKKNGRWVREGTYSWDLKTRIKK
jgi:RHS repeat-associated protein